MPDRLLAHTPTSTSRNTNATAPNQFNDEEKYRTLATSLDSDVFTLVNGASQTAMPGQRYSALKSAIIANFADSDTQRLKKTAGWHSTGR